MALQLRLLGPLDLSRDGHPLDLPASRKLRAILAYLALAPRATSRHRLCELFLVTASNPRAELRWYLSKLRAVVGAACLRLAEDSVRLELVEGDIDARRVQRAMRTGVDTLSAQRARELEASFRGEFLEGLEIDHCPEFMGWVLAQRRRFRATRLALLERLSRCVPDDEAVGHIEKWLEIAPFDIRAHEHLFGALARCERFRDLDEHLATATKSFRAESLDCAALRNAWSATHVRPPVLTKRGPATAASEQAYDLYLLGRQHLARMMHHGLEESRRLFNRAIELDAGYGPAWAGLATAHACTYEWFDTGKASLARADQASRRALEAAPQLAESHVARAFVCSQSEDYDEAVGEFEEAIRLNPYLFDSYYYFARAAFARGDTKRAADMFRAAAEVRVEDFQSSILLAMPMNALGKEDAARDALRTGIRRAELMLALNPSDGRALSLGSGALMEDGQADRALAWAARALELYPRDTSALINVACMYVKAGERVRAMDLLDRVFAQGFGKRDWVANDPDYSVLRGEPRFQRMFAHLK
jgi:DNA-binding SARP family transcriptional activator/Tfp pilus assembly protein PilF